MTAKGFSLSEDDFNNIYSAYPRKLGKKTGYLRLKKSIRKEQEWLDFARAVENYAKLCNLKQTELQYIMLFSTFANKRWLDFVDAEAIDWPKQASKSANPLANYKPKE